MSEGPVLTWEREGPVVVLTLNRPETRNMISVELTDALVEACARLHADVSAKCAILTAAGSVFCAGGNLKAMHDREHHFAGNPAQMLLPGLQLVTKLKGVTAGLPLNCEMAVAHSGMAPSTAVPEAPPTR